MIAALLALIPGIGIVTKILGAAIEIATPIVVALVQFTLWYLKKLWEGLVDISDNLGSIMLLLTVGFAGFVAGTYAEPVKIVTKTISKCNWGFW